MNTSDDQIVAEATGPAHVGVVGGGLMGCGIAERFIAAGHAVTVFEADADAAARVADRCAVIAQERVDGGRATLDDVRNQAGRLSVASDLAALHAASVVFEAVPEVLADKHAVYRALSAVMAPDAVLASTTSGFPPDALAEGVEHPRRFLVAHFWNPPHLVPLVEVVAAAATAPAVRDRIVVLLRKAGCDPVVLQRAVPGFIGNRLQFALLREALHLLQEGVADAETIDRVVTASIGRRYAHIGPLAGADVGGLGTFTAIAAHLMPTLAQGTDGLSALQAHVARGELGRATGQGFHTWDAGREAWLNDVRLRLQRD